MSCYACGSGFGLFGKEHGCKNCGFAFCGKCLTKKHAIPKMNNEKHRVCNKCYNILTGKIKPTEEPREHSPPEAYLKRVAALQEREEHGAVKKPVHKNKTKYPGLSKAEREIAERLDKLKEKTPEQKAKENISEKEIKERLSKLKGENPEVQSAENKKFYVAPDRRTQQVQVDDLLDEIANEVELDSRLPDPVLQIEQRLSKLKGESTDSDKTSEKPRNRNDLNRDDSQESKPFTQNIASDTTKRTNEGGGEISVEEMNKIIEETTRECEEDAKKALLDLEKDKDIMKRLQEIKSRQKEDVNKQGDGSLPVDGGDNKNQENTENSDSDNEDQMANNIVKQILEENKLDEAAAKDGISVNTNGKTCKPAGKVPKTEEEYEDDDELPYCTMCTEDATIRCHGCDLDLYCNKCWKESHVEFQMEDHVTSKYVKPKDWT